MTMSQRTSPPAEYLSGKAYIARKTASTSATTSRPTQEHFNLASPPPIPARSPVRVRAPSLAFSPIGQARVQSPKATTSPLIPTLPPPAEKQVGSRAGADEEEPELVEKEADEDYPQLIEDDDYMELHAQQQQPRRVRPSAYHTHSQRLENIAEEDDAPVSEFAAAPAEYKPEKWSEPLPSSFSKQTTKEHGKAVKEGAKPVMKGQGGFEKKSLSLRDKASKTEDDPDKEEDEKRFI